MLTGMMRTAPCSIVVVALAAAALLSACHHGEPVRATSSTEETEVKPASSTRAEQVSAPSVLHVDADGAEKLLKNDPETVVLDVRTPEEFARERLPGAINIDFLDANFPSEVGKLNRDKTYLVHCASGRRSSQALEVLKELGFESIVHLDGGLNAWKVSQKPVVK
jgi:rhodanese-related sulfurtransferase